MNNVIFVTGDIHGELGIKKLAVDSFLAQKDFANQDENFVIITGDFGLVWSQKESPTEKYWLDWLENKNFTTLFVDGNHENYDRLATFPVEEWNGGKVQRIRPHVIHLMRGQVFTIEGKKFFTFGGASSHDIQDGILDPADYTDEENFREVYRRWRQMFKMFRVKGVSWWSQELPSQEEMKEGFYNLSNHNYEIDFIITHCAPTTTARLVLFGIGMFHSDILTDYLEGIRQCVKFKKWFFGHYHDDKNINEKEVMLYNDIIRIN